MTRGGAAGIWKKWSDFFGVETVGPGIIVNVVEWWEVERNEEQVEGEGSVDGWVYDHGNELLI